jgi:hypothetical protein
MDYYYNGARFNNIVGNYWGDYVGFDNNSDGIGDSPYIAHTMIDYHPWIAKTLTIDSATAFTVALQSGWNLISVPIVASNQSILSLFPANVRSDLIDIWGWDELAQDWVYYSSNPNDYYYRYYPRLTQLEIEKAYWVEMARPASFVIEGVAPDQAPFSTVALRSGWNFVGTTGSSIDSVKLMYSSATDVWGRDESRQDWVYYSPNKYDYYYRYYPELNTLTPGHGYWVEMA